MTPMYETGRSSATSPLRAGLPAGLAGVLLLAAAAPLPAPAGGPDFPDRLAAHGIRPVEPPSPATDFTLPALGGGERSLSAESGNWVVLTFFATWCGPCVSEMPSLQTLSDALGHRGVSVLGVSIDEDRAVLEGFVDRLGVAFPVLWDARGEAAALYRAGSIPLSYLIDPAGRIVGVARGARDWSALAGLLESALEWQPPGEADSHYAPGGGAVSLPAAFEPPSATITHTPQRPRAGEPFHVDVRVHWSGTFDDYLLQPPVVSLPEGVEQSTVSASTSTREGRNVVTYRVELSAEEPGAYALDPVEIRYIPRFESAQQATRMAGPTVTVRSFTIAGMPPAAAGAVAAAVAAGGLGAVLIVARLRRRASARPSGTESRHETMQAALARARAARLEGNAEGAVTALGEVDRQITGDGVSADPELSEWIEKARFGGQAPPPDVMDRLVRRLERRVEELRPSAERAARAAVRLRESPKEG